MRITLGLLKTGWYHPVGQSVKPSLTNHSGACWIIPSRGMYSSVHPYDVMKYYHGDIFFILRSNRGIVTAYNSNNSPVTLPPPQDFRGNLWVPPKRSTHHQTRPYFCTASTVGERGSFGAPSDSQL